MLDGRRGQDAVPEIEYVPRPSRDPAEHVFGLFEHPAWRAEKQRGIEIALHSAIETNLLPGDVNRNTPVHADDVAASLT